MNFTAVVDTSAFIWDRADFEANQYEYWDLISMKIDLLDIFQKNRIQHALRDELIEKIWINFPYSETPQSTKDFQSRVISYLSKTQFIQYEDLPIEHIHSNPNQLKSHFSDDVKNEVALLLSEMHRNVQKFSYFTFAYLWQGINVDNLQTIVNTETESPKDYDTIVINSSEDVKEYLDTIKPKFEHNPKHDKSVYKNKEAWEKSDDKEGFLSQLSCYNGDPKDIRPQEILDNRYPEDFGEKFISYDDENEVFVVFRCHEDNKYHGYDEYNENNPSKIPPKVKSYFNK
ncbi:MAG: hypothetical protein AAF587_12545 [Bacteroidota bacterium]